MVATTERVHWYGHHSPSLHHRHANPRRAQSRLGTRPPPPGTTTTSNHRHQINQPPQNPGHDIYVERAEKVVFHRGEFSSLPCSVVAKSVHPLVSVSPSQSPRALSGRSEPSEPEIEVSHVMM